MAVVEPAAVEADGKSAERTRLEQRALRLVSEEIRNWAEEAVVSMVQPVLCLSLESSTEPESIEFEANGSLPFRYCRLLSTIPEILCHLFQQALFEARSCRLPFIHLQRYHYRRHHHYRMCGRFLGFLICSSHNEFYVEILDRPQLPELLNCEQEKESKPFVGVVADR